MMLHSRRRFLSAATLVGGWMLLRRAHAAPSTDHERTAGELITPAAQAAIDKGLAWLAARQVDDGSFKSSGFGRELADFGFAADKGGDFGGQVVGKFGRGGGGDGGTLADGFGEGFGLGGRFDA